MASGDLLTNKLIATRLDVDEAVADSATWAGSESGALLSVTAYLESGVRYRVFADVAIGAAAVGSPSAEADFVRIRQDSATGTQLAGRQVYIASASSVGFGVTVCGEYTATGTGNKTFVVTGNRNGGSNNHSLRAAAGRSALLTIDRINT